MRVVIPSVGYADMLAQTLPAWKTVLPASVDLRVVTAEHDTETQAVAQTVGVDVVVTDAWTSDAAQFNKAAALDVGFGFAGRGSAPRQNETCLSIDADVFPASVVLPTSAQVMRGVLYGASRHLCLDPETLAQVAAGTLDPLTLPRRNGGERGAGYFQLFKYRSELSYGSFPTAGYYDLEFHQFFDKVVDLPSVVVAHLGRTSSRNWTGRRHTPTWGRHG